MALGSVFSAAETTSGRAWWLRRSAPRALCAFSDPGTFEAVAGPWGQHHHESSCVAVSRSWARRVILRGFSGVRYSTSCHWRARTRGCWPAWDHAPGAAWRESVSNWKKARTSFVAELDPDQSLEAMLELEAKSMPQRISEFYQARYRLLRGKSDFFSMGLRLADGPWLACLPAGDAIG